MEEQVGPGTVCGVVSAEICAMTRRAAELAEEAMRDDGLGPPPVPYAVLVLGSAGRGESQLAADQDNAIVYAEGAEGGPEDRYFEQLATRMNETLDAAGVPFCNGGVMAKNRAWRKSLEDWHATIDKWMTGERASHLLNVDIFFDAVPVHGQAGLADAVWGHAYDRAHQAIDFQNLLIESARERASPFGFLGRFKVDEKGRIDLKKYGLMPLFTAARVLSIRHDVRARSSTDRLRGVAAKGLAPGERSRPPSTRSARCWPPCSPSSSSTPRPACRSPRGWYPIGSTRRTGSDSRWRCAMSIRRWSWWRRGGSALQGCGCDLYECRASRRRRVAGPGSPGARGHYPSHRLGISRRSTPML